MFTVYILKSKVDNGYYIGYTSNLERRMVYHVNGYSRTTKYRLPVELVYTEEIKNKTEALMRERQLKKYKSKKYIDFLISERQ
jgi:putative endonuclease